jgi:hypothetical protein
MQMFAALRGDTKQVYNQYWTSLGVNRFARAGWETRLGPSDGVRDGKTGRGVTFAPTWMEGDKWVRLADVPERYAGTFSVQFAHPLLVRCTIDYAPLAGATGPRFRHEFLVTPDGILATLKTDDTVRAGVTWPILENDGKPLVTHVTDGIATTAYDDAGDQECFIAVGDGKIDASEDPLRSTYGWLRPARADARQTFIYPRNASDPPAEKVRASLRTSADGFESALGRVIGNLYVGRTSAGGEGRSIDLDGDGKPEASFNVPCCFVFQLRDRKIIAAEADRDVSMEIAGRSRDLKAFKPLALAAGQQDR